MRPQPDRPTAAIGCGEDGHAAKTELRLAHETPLHLEPRVILPDRRPGQKDFEQAFARSRYSAFPPSFASHLLA